MRDDRILVDDDDTIMDRVVGVITILSFDIIYSDPAPVADPCILIDDGLTDDSGLSDTDIRDLLFRIRNLFFF